MVTMVTTKNITVVFQMCQTIHPQNYMFVLAVQTEIFDTGYCWIVHLSFLTSHNLLFFRFCKTSKKNNIFGFSVVFSRKIAQISIFKVEYLENGVADFNDFGLILQDFERPFRWNQLVLALQFSFNKRVQICQESQFKLYVVRWLSCAEGFQMSVGM